MKQEMKAVLQKSKPKIVVIAGPTASGKSALAVEVARMVGGEVVSADSRQVYRGLDIGSGKITRREMKGVPHHLLDVASPARQFSAARYVALAQKAIAGIVKRHKIPILCGGTGFYIDALLGNATIPEIPPNTKLRTTLAKKNPEELFALLQKLNPARAKTIEQKNPRRLVRAIEIALALGAMPKNQKQERQEKREQEKQKKQKKAGEQKQKYDAIYFGLDAPDETLKKNIHTRLISRIKKGMIAEGEKLHKDGLSWKRLEALGLEYKYVALFLQKKITRETMLQEIETKSWHYTKRQRRWFRRNKEIFWMVQKPENEIEKNWREGVLLCIVGKLNLLKQKEKQEKSGV